MLHVVDKPEPPRGNGVTILIGNQVMFTQPVIAEDRRFLALAMQWIMDFYKGNPRA
jgi:hypothetical protein